MVKKTLTALLICALLLPFLRLPVVAADDAILSSLVHIDARPSFTFRKDLTNSSSGEASPILEDYYLSAYKVTNAQYKEFITATSHKAPSYWKNGTYPAGKGDHPVLNVSYSDAVSYCAWLCEKYTDWHFRLPTEAEWENAAMGSYYADPSVKYPSGSATPSYNTATGVLTTTFNYNGVIAAKLFRDYGSDYMVNYIKGDYAGTSETLGQCISISASGGVSNWANHGSAATKGYFLQTDLYAAISADGGYTTPVGTFPANTLGLYDMAGNCWDLTASRIVAVNGLEAGVSCYAVRGGSWYATARSCTFYYRGEGRKDSPSATVGFRLAADYIGGQQTCDHTYSSWTQTDDASHQQVCSACGDVKTENHHWDSGAVTSPATCQQTGLLTYTCTDCSAVSTQTLSKTDSHLPGTGWLQDSTSHWRQCTICSTRTDEGPHLPGTDSNQACPVCGYMAAPPQTEAPTEPSAPTDASAPSASTDAAESTEITESTETTKPAETTESTEAAKPAETTESTEAAKPSESTEAATPAAPDNSAQPAASFPWWLLFFACAALIGVVVWIAVKHN